MERGANIVDGSASITTTPAAITALAADNTRRSVTITNLGTDYVWIGSSSITTNRGLRVAPGQTVIIDKAPTPALWGASTSGTQTIAYFVEKD